MITFAVLDHFFGLSEHEIQSKLERGEKVTVEEANEMMAVIRELMAELARRTASLHYANTVCMEQKHVIDRLKEDAERLASNYVIEAFPHEWVCRGGCHHWARFGEQIDHAPDCPITLHRALMKELE